MEETNSTIETPSTEQTTQEPVNSRSADAPAAAVQPESEN